MLTVVPATPLPAADAMTGIISTITVVLRVRRATALNAPVNIPARNAVEDSSHVGAIATIAPTTTEWDALRARIITGAQRLLQDTC